MPAARVLQVGLAFWLFAGLPTQAVDSHAAESATDSECQAGASCDDADVALMQVRGKGKVDAVPREKRQTGRPENPVDQGMSSEAPPVSGIMAIQLNGTISKLTVNRTVSEPTVDLAPAGPRSIAQEVSLQLHYELHLSAAEVGEKNKLLLALLELLGLGMFGIDRCYMGQVGLGIVKGVTLGGLSVWALMDYICVLVTCLSRSPAINALGLRANFAESSVVSAFYFVLVVVLIQLSICVYHSVRRMMKPSTGLWGLDQGDNTLLVSQQAS